LRERADFPPNSDDVLHWCFHLLWRLLNDLFGLHPFLSAAPQPQRRPSTWPQRSSCGMHLTSMTDGHVLPFSCAARLPALACYFNIMQLTNELNGEMDKHI
jgi:hypothetical protein